MQFNSNACSTAGPDGVRTLMVTAERGCASGADVG